MINSLYKGKALLGCSARIQGLHLCFGCRGLPQSLYCLYSDTRQRLHCDYSRGFFFFFFFLCFSSFISGVRFSSMSPAFISPNIEVVAFRFCGWDMLGVFFFAGIHSSRTGMSESFGSVPVNACVHRLDLGLHSHPQEFWGNGIRTDVSSKGKKNSIGSSKEDRTHDAASRRTASPTHYRLSYFGPHTRGYKINS